MADNTVLSPGSGGDTIATDDLGAYGKVQRVKPNLGADGTAVDAVPVSNGMDTTAAGVQAVGIVGQLDDSSTGAVTENQFAPVRISSRRALLVEGVASGTAVPVSGTLTAVTTVAAVTAITNALPAGANVLGHVISDTGSTTAVTGNVTAVQATGTNLHAVIDSGSTTAATQATAANLNAQVQGPAAHGASTSGNPLWLGQEAIAHGTNPSAVTAGQLTKLYANRAGIPFVMGGHPNIVTIELAFTAAQTDVAIVTVAAGNKIVVTACDFVCSHANSVDVSVRIGFGTASTPTTTGVVLTHPNVAAGSGISRGAGSGILGIGADDEDLRITASVPTSGSARALVTYYTVPS